MNTALMYASVGSWDSVGAAIENTANSINDFFKSIFGFLTNDTIYNNVIGKVPDGVKSAIAASALSILGLIFIINFLGKTLNLQWVTWENVLMLLMQLLIAKVCVQNSEWIMGTIQKGFTSMIQSVPESEITQFIDTTTTKSVFVEHLAIKGGGDGNDIKNQSFNVPVEYFYFLDEQDAAKAYAAAGEGKKVYVGLTDFSPAVAFIGVFVNGLIMKVILAVALIMMVARFMWLAVYTVAAPLSLATFAADETKDIGKSFIKSYVGVCLHAMVLLIICVSFGAVSSVLSDIPALGGFIGLVKTFAFGGMIMKSESVANKLCGAM